MSLFLVYLLLALFFFLVFTYFPVDLEVFYSGHVKKSLYNTIQYNTVSSPSEGIHDIVFCVVVVKSVNITVKMPLPAQLRLYPAKALFVDCVQHNECTAV